MLQAVAWNIRQVRDLCSKFRKSDETFFHELCRPCTRFFHWHERAAAALFWYDAIIAQFLTLQVQRLQRHAAGRTLYAIALMARVLLYHSFCIRLFFKQIWGFLLRCRAEVLFLGGTGALVWWSGVARVLEADSALASFCYMAGVAASIWMLRRRNIQELLKDDESSLDMYLEVSLIATFTFTPRKIGDDFKLNFVDETPEPPDRYARQAGFIAVWRRKSQKQFIKATGCLILLCVSRCLAYVQAPVSSHELIQTSTFCFASIGFVAVTYLQLHISKGLELAIDSFAVNFFKEMDFEKALAEWNVLQAMLRHVSTKLSGSLLMLGVSSGSSILYLIELSFVRTDVGGGFGFILQNLWSLPPIIVFLYTMMRAAAVTEKASRVSPLVNSWTFEDKQPFGDEEEQVWMDLERQYLVQYINQSEAGFYVQGVKIRNFQVTKMCYYLGAILFTIVSQSAM